MPVDLSVFGRQKSVIDQQQLQQEFELKKALARAELQKASALDIDKLGEQAVFKAMQGGELSPQETAAARMYGAKGGGVGFDPTTGNMYQKPDMLTQLGINLGQKSVTPSPAMPTSINPITQPTAKPTLNPKLQQELDKKRVERLEKLQGDLPRIESGANLTNQMVNDMVSDPALSRAVGTVSSKLPTFRGSTADFENKVKQLQGGAFLEAYQSLKGGGAISEVEGLKAEQAISRMQLSSSEKGFKAALKDFNSVVQRALANQRKSIGNLEKSLYGEQVSGMGSLTPAIDQNEPNVDAILSNGLQPRQAQPSKPKAGTMITAPDGRKGMILPNGNVRIME